MNNESQRIIALYQSEYEHDIDDWNYIWNPRNNVSVFLRQQRERVLIQGLNAANISLKDAPILDLGCGDGDLLRFFVELGANPSNMRGIDLVPERIKRAQEKSPHIQFSTGDISASGIETNSYSIICLFTVFSSIHNPEIQQTIAKHVTSILHNEGVVIWFDIIHKNPNAQKAQGLTEHEVHALFPSLQPVFSKQINARLALPFIERGMYAFAEFAERLPVQKTNLFTILCKK